MAYMFVKDGKFYPFDSLGENLADIGHKLNSGFDVDTLLAYPVSVLNNKGYLTEQCCEGHPLKEPYYVLAEEYKKKNIENRCDGDSIFEIQKNDDGDNYICFEGYSNPGAFVIFKRDISLPSTPTGWLFQDSDNSIRWDCGEYNNPTDYYTKLIIQIESLTYWAEGLPSML